MRKISILYILALTLLAASCDVFSPDFGPQEISLHARFGGRGLQTKSLDSSYVYHTQSQVEIPIALSRIDQSDANYPSFSNCGNYKTAKMRTPDASGIREIHLDKAQFYKNSTDYIKYVGFAPVPAAGKYTSAASGTNVTYNIDGYTDVIYGSVITGKEGSGFPTMYFNHALSEVRIWVYQSVAIDEDGNIIETQDNWGDFESLSLEGLRTECSLTLPKDDEAQWGIAYGNNTADLEFTEASALYFNPGEIPISAGEKRKVGVAIIAPPADNLLNIRYKTTGLDESKLVTIAKDFLPGYAYDIILRFSQFGLIEPVVTVSDWLGSDGEITDVTIDQGVRVFNNLSRYGTSNCYILNSGNSLYGFDCKVKGNGNADLVNDKNVDLDVNFLKILWKDPSIPDTITLPDSNGGAKDVPYLNLSKEPSDNLAKIEVAGRENQSDHTLTHEGNVLVGGYDKDPAKGGKLLWTWHLWLTKKVTADGDGYGYNIQDRNLGASSTDKTAGLYYQWGRMTPLRQTGNTTQAAVAPTINDAVVNYTTVYGSGDWLANTSENRTTLWGYQDDFKEQQKTIYDPCPLGYTVADKNVWDHNSVASGDRVWTFASLVQGTALTFPKTGADFTQTRRAALTHVRCIAEGKEARFVKNLSEAQTANSYIVSKSGYYKFNVLTRGNGIASIEPMGGGGRVWDLNHGLPETIQRAEIANIKPRWWQGDFSNYGSWNNITPATNRADLDTQMGGIKFLHEDGSWGNDYADVDEEGYVYFQITDWKPGNLLLAAYDLNNVVLWSWHIWLTEEPKNIRLGNYAILDRNLGATYVPTTTTFANINQRSATYGFFYQWGRKDPLFHEAPSATATQGTVSGNTASSSVWYFNDPRTGWERRNSLQINTTASSMSIDASRKSPEVFFKASSQAGANSVWFLPEYAADGDKSSTAFWGYAVYSTNFGRSFTKTVNDPCPPGYRTLHHNTMFENGGDGNDRDITNGVGDGPTNITNYNGERAVVAKGGNNGIIVKYKGDNIYWPFSGRRQYNGQTTAMLTAANYFTGMPMGAYNTRAGAFYREGNTYYHVHNAGTYGTSTGMVIRCMKE